MPYVEISHYYNSVYLAVIVLMYGMINIKMFADDKELQKQKKTEFGFSIIILILLLAGLGVSTYRALHKD
jgi:hypothetical protein